MKVRFNFLFIILMMFAFALDANPVNRMIIKIEKGEDASVIDLRLANLEKMATKVAILDVSGIGWYEEWITNKNGYAKKIVLTGMPDSDYLIYIGNRHESYMQGFTIEDEEVFFYENAPLKPTVDDNPMITYLTEEGGFILGVQLANLVYKKATVSLVMHTGDVMFEESVEGLYAYAKKINMEGMTKGAYFFHINTPASNTVTMLHMGEFGVWIKNTQRLKKPVYAVMPVADL